MDSTTNDNNVYILLLLGMVAVGAHAYNLFNQPIERPSTSTRWRFLATIPIQLATTQSRFRLGLVFYVVVFELIYLVLSSSSSLLLMAYQMSGRQDLTGALSETVAPNSTVPILASTGLILLTQIRPFSQLEVMLRRFAHRMARVPDGLKMVKSRAADFLSHAQLPNEEQVREDFTLLARFTEPVTAARLIRSQTNAAWLFEHTLGPKGSMAWDEEGSDELLQLFKSLRLEVSQLQNDIETEINKADTSAHNAVAGAAPTKPHLKGPWQELLKQSLHLEERLTLLLCLLLINQPEVDTRHDATLENLIEKTRRRERSEVTDIAIRSSFYGVIVCLLALFAFELGESRLRNNLNQSPYSSKAPFGDFVEARLDNTSEAASLYPFTGVTAKESEKYAFSAGTQIDLQISINETLWTAIAFLSAVLVTLSMNTRHIHAWHDSETQALNSMDAAPKNQTINVWKSQNIPLESVPVTPTVHYLFISLAAFATAATSLFVYMFISKALLPALQKRVDVLSFEIMGPFSSMLPAVLRLSLAAAVCAIFVIWLDGILTKRPLKLPLSLRSPTSLRSAVKLLASLPLVIATRLSSVWIVCVATAGAAAILVLIASIAIGQSIEWIDTFDRLSGTFIAFLSFLICLAVVMQLHPRRHDVDCSSTMKLLTDSGRKEKETFDAIDADQQA